MFWRLVAWAVSRPAVSRWIIDRAVRTPYSHIETDGTRYMGRWWLFNPYENAEQGGPPLRRFSWFPISVRLHHIARPDLDRHLHDHPWNARTIILKGGYCEMREDGCFYFRRPGSTARLRFGEYHKIVEVEPRGAVTLFITGRYRGTWGFKTDAGKVPYREYLGLPPKAPKAPEPVDVVGEAV